MLAARLGAKQMLTRQNQPRDANTLDPAQQITCRCRLSDYVENARIRKPFCRDLFCRIDDQNRGRFDMQRTKFFNHFQSRLARHCHHDAQSARTRDVGAKVIDGS